MTVPIFYELPQGLNALIFLVTMLLALEVSYRFALWKTDHTTSSRPPGSGGDVVPTAMLALLGLLLAFTYSFTVSRSDNRKAANLSEVNAIGTAFLRADLLAEPERTALRKALFDYARTLKVEKSGAARDNIPKVLNRMTDAQAGLWPVVRRIEKPLGPSEVAVVASINEVLDAHTTRVTVVFDMLPTAILIMLLFVAAAAMAVAGYSSGRRGSMQRWRMTALALSISAVMVTVMDFDRPLTGFVRSNQQGYMDLVAQMEAAMRE